MNKFFPPQAQADSTLEPGSTISVPFTVAMANGTGGAFTVRATNDRGFTSSFPASVSIVTGEGAANGTVTLTAPSSTPSGTDVTLTIEAESAGAADLNYAILRLSVVSKVSVMFQNSKMDLASFPHILSPSWP